MSGPTSAATTFDVHTRGHALVGEVSVSSAGQAAKVGLLVSPPSGG